MTGRPPPARPLLAAAALGLALAGCVSVPLSTIVRMSTFSERDFVALDPDVLRVRIQLPQGFALDAGRSALGVDITADAGVHHGEFRLEPESVAPTVLGGGLLSAGAPGTAYTLKLAAASKKEFKKLQAFVDRGPPGEAVIRVIPILSSFPADAETVDVWVDLRLSEAQGFFTLLDAAEVPMEAIRRASAAAAD